MAFTTKTEEWSGPRPGSKFYRREALQDWIDARIFPHGFNVANAIGAFESGQVSPSPGVMVIWGVHGGPMQPDRLDVRIMRLIVDQEPLPELPKFLTREKGQ